jgi:WD40 repeat protein
MRLICSHLSVHDVRFSRSKPMLTLKGHVNHYMRDCGLDVFGDDLVAAGRFSLAPSLGVQFPKENVSRLFSAGQDGRVRIWSLRSGGQILPSETSNESIVSRKFEEPVKSVLFGQGEARGGRSGALSLWTASGTELERWGVE